MLIKNVTVSEAQDALKTANAEFGGNLEFKRIESVRSGVQATIRVSDSRGPGARRGLQRRNDGKRRRSPSACWHAWGTFMDSLPAKAVIIMTWFGYTEIRPGDPWVDYRMGSLYDPCYISELCDCYR